MDRKWGVCTIALYVAHAWDPLDLEDCFLGVPVLAASSESLERDPVWKSVGGEQEGRCQLGEYHGLAPCAVDGFDCDNAWAMKRCAPASGEFTCIVQIIQHAFNNMRT